MTFHSLVRFAILQFSASNMYKIIFPTFLWFVLIALDNCTPSRREPSVKVSDSASFEIKYAHGFKVSDRGSYKMVEVTYPYQGAQSGYTYLLVQKGEPIPAHDPTTPVITVPLENIVCTSTTHIPALDYLNETDALIGFPSTDYISSKKMRTRIDEGKVTDLGIDKGMNLELLATLKPSMVMGYSMNNDLGQLKKIQELGIPIVVNAEYLEKHPLGRAEWIKFVALFFNKEKVADSIFRWIEVEYHQTQELVKTVDTRPTVLSGIVYGDTWFLPGGQNYAARLLEDAGCHYVWKEDPSNGFLELSFESVYEKAKDADLWIGVGSFRSLAEIQAAEVRYTRFKPFHDGKV